MQSFQPVATLRDDSGLVAEITSKKLPNGYTTFSCAMFREFEMTAGSETKRTAFIPERLFSQARKLFDRAAEAIRVEQDKLVAAKRNHG